MLKLMEEWLYRFFFIWYLIGLVVVAFHLLPARVTWAYDVFFSVAALLALRYMQKTFGSVIGCVVTAAIAGISYMMFYIFITLNGYIGSFTFSEKWTFVVEGVPVMFIGMVLLTIAATHAVVQLWQLPTFIKPVMATCLTIVLVIIVQPVGVTLQFWAQQLQMSTWLIYVSAVLIGVLCIQVFLQYAGFANVHKWTLKLQFVYYALWGMFVFWALLHSLFQEVIMSTLLLIVMVLVGKGSTYGREKQS
ncbi:hypothetical protein [Caryophanon tenue]|uniref:Uncharacterized protein n=1 Tax=Caryophanon tenue TaxID=33978 RepID=A0A1C0YE47_9BACL|nr:hypothetical protein [Caryophanon tenue]OCS85462.1 hypothetical protein A6M13_13580 [Caryophanon tenue]